MPGTSEEKIKEIRKLQHNINNALNVITGYAHLLGEQKGIPAECRSDVDKITRYSETLEDLLSKLQQKVSDLTQDVNI